MAIRSTAGRALRSSLRAQVAFRLDTRLIVARVARERHSPRGRSAVHFRAKASENRHVESTALIARLVTVAQDVCAVILPADPAARLAAVCSAVPEHCVGPEETAHALRVLFPGEDPDFIAQIVERSGVEQRHIALDLEETLRPRDFTQRNACYREIAAELALRAARGALERARVPASTIDV